MKHDDAPPPGWYPDPEGRSGVRWWAGADWTEQRRPNPPASAREQPDDLDSSERRKPAASRRSARSPAEVFTSNDASRAAAEIRDATRQEIERAAQEISKQFQSSISRMQPTIVEQFTRILRWVRIGIIAAAVLVVVWFVLQFLAQAAFLNWLGDRVDNIIS